MTNDRPLCYTIDPSTRDYKPTRAKQGVSFWGWELAPNQHPRETRRLALASTWIEPGDFLAKDNNLLFVLNDSNQHGVLMLDLDSNRVITVGSGAELSRAKIYQHSTGAFLAVAEKEGGASYVLHLHSAHVVCYPDSMETARRIASAMDRWYYHPAELAGQYLYEQIYRIGSYTVKRNGEKSFILSEGKRELAESETIHDALKVATALKDIHKPNRVVADKWTDDPIMRLESF